MAHPLEAWFRRLVEGSSRRSLLVLAPHPDDEVIGCYLLLKYWQGDKSVVWLSPDRAINADTDAVCERFPGLTPWSVGLGALPGFMMRHGFDVIAVPNSLDHHPFHREVTVMARRQQHLLPRASEWVYYSVSKNAPGLIDIGPAETEQKRATLAACYAEQEIWQKDEGQVLFEAYAPYPGRQYVEVRLRFYALHHWPGAKGDQRYLSRAHRHLFHVRARLEVFGDDREVEFLDMGSRLVGRIGAWNGQDVGGLSCEMMAQQIADWLAYEYPNAPRQMDVEVSEDGENGAIVSR